MIRTLLVQKVIWLSGTNLLLRSDYVNTSQPPMTDANLDKKALKFIKELTCPELENARSVSSCFYTFLLSLQANGFISRQTFSNLDTWHKTLVDFGYNVSFAESKSSCLSRTKDVYYKSVQHNIFSGICGSSSYYWCQKCFESICEFSWNVFDFSLFFLDGWSKIRAML